MASSHSRQRSQTPSDSGGPAHPLLPPTPEKEAFSITELLTAQAAQEAEAAKVLPWNFSKCTNPMGPGMRQAVYSCLTCNPKEGERRGGVCSGCSISCHGDHELVELFSRRDFVCDCGTSRLGPEASCTLSGRTPATSKPHADNKYDHTFVGEFCICEKGKTYDPATEEDEMFQCLVCEDWRHAACLGPHPHPDDFDTLICASCLTSNPAVSSLIKRYLGAPNSGVMICLGEGEANLKGRVLSSDEEGKLETVREEDEEAEQEEAVVATAQKSSSPAPYSGPVSLKRSAPSPTTSPSKRPRIDDSTSVSSCIAPHPPPPAEEYLSSAGELKNVYLAEGWRERWCDCTEKGCRAFFDTLPYFLEEEEEMQVEEDEDSKKSLHDLGMQAFSSLPRAQAIDGLQAYSNLRDKMMAFLRPFAEAGEVVTKDAIEAFFEADREERRQALRASGAM